MLVFCTHGRRKGDRGGLGTPGLWNFPIKILTKKCCFLSFEWVKWNFTTIGHPRKNLYDAHICKHPIEDLYIVAITSIKMKTRFWCILHTGSTDATVYCVCRCMHHLPAAIAEMRYFGASAFGCSTISRSLHKWWQATESVILYLNVNLMNVLQVAGNVKVPTDNSGFVLR